MRTAMDASPNSLDPDEKKFVEAIQTYGWHSTGVFAEHGQPSFTYTTGFHVSLDFSEVIVFSLKSEIAHDVMWDIYRDVKAGRRYPVGVRIHDLFSNRDAYLLPVDKRHYDAHLGWSKWFYGGDQFPCLQLVWPDSDDRFPWEAGFSDKFARLQPDLTSDGWMRAIGQ